MKPPPTRYRWRTTRAHGVARQALPSAAPADAGAPVATLRTGSRISRIASAHNNPGPADDEQYHPPRRVAGKRRGGKSTRFDGVQNAAADENGRAAAHRNAAQEKPDGRAAPRRRKIIADQRYGGRRQCRLAQADDDAAGENLAEVVRKTACDRAQTPHRNAGEDEIAPRNAIRREAQAGCRRCHRSRRTPCPSSRLICVSLIPSSPRMGSTSRLNTWRSVYDRTAVAIRIATTVQA